MREVAIDAISKLPNKKIGGQDKIVEIHETLFSKRKNNAGRIITTSLDFWWDLS